ncbi:phage antirepressor Ant [Bartonella rattaustraliani]|uniref:phage antirepressor Ant n=1 Tax=Bartonella rattaustraliani TaxID=481139 RepID=UPI0002D4F368|nr:phage antirepressor Ant [Bartonella rattaustraliani]
MTQNLINVNQTQIDGEFVQTVNARELHAFLEIKSEFRNWIKNRIKECKFCENIDFITAVNFYRGAQMKEYHITLDMAKHLSMIERNDKGHEAREYFIECERRAKQAAAPQQIDYSSPQVMLGVLTHLKNENERKDIVIAELKPKAMALESLQRSDGLFGLTEAAKIMEMQPREFIIFLQKRGWVYRRTFGSPLLPYQDKIKKGLMDCSTHTLQTTKGTEKVVPAAKITTKGMGVLSEQLKKQICIH